MSSKKLNLKIHARSIFLQGLLLNFYNNGVYVKKFDKFRYILDNLKVFQYNNKISALEHALSFICNIKFVAGILIGVDNERHLEEIINTKIKKIPKFSKPIPPELKDPRKWLVTAGQ